MRDDVVIRAESVSKKFCRSLRRSMLYGVQDIACDTLGMRITPDRLRKDEFWAVNDVSFEIRRGECFGVTGPNGAGKSTLLKMLNGLILPDKGKITMRGRVGALIEVGAGFHPMLTGRENIYISGSILGLSKKKIDQMFDEIVAFAELEEFIDSPVKFYSSGMYVRLGFAVAIHADPDILLVDEVLAVGDTRFQLKCIDRMKELISLGTSVILVTHDIYSVRNFCYKALWLHRGKSHMYGDGLLVTNAYSDFMQNGIDSEPQGVNKSFSKSPLTIRNVQILDSSNQERDDFKFGDTIVVKIDYELHESVEKGVVGGVAVFDNKNNYVCGLNTKLDAIPIPSQRGMHTLRLEYKQVKILPGSYYIDVGFFEDSAIVALDYKARCRMFKIEGDEYKAEGIFVMEHVWRI